MVHSLGNQIIFQVLLSLIPEIPISQNLDNFSAGDNFREAKLITFNSPFIFKNKTAPKLSWDASQRIIKE